MPLPRRRGRGGSRRSELSIALQSAIANDELVLYYQPQIVVASGTLVGFEALLRWRHPTRGLALPVNSFQFSNKPE